MIIKGRFVSPPIRLNPGPKGLNFDRADIEFHGVDQSGPSFEGRVFLNNPAAGLDTPTTAENGYAGSFHVFGYGIWPADVGKDRTSPAPDPDTIRAPIQKTLIATDAVRAAAARGLDITVTVIPVFPGTPPRDASQALKLQDVRIAVH